MNRIAWIAVGIWLATLGIAIWAFHGGSTAALTLPNWITSGSSVIGAGLSAFLGLYTWYDVRRKRSGSRAKPIRRR